VLLQSVASADEGLYALVAREWLRGHLPYTTVWETKPPLLFALLAGAFELFGTSIVTLRFATDLAIFATAVALYAIGASLHRDGRSVGATAAVLYATLTLSDGASSALAETFYAPFVAIPLAFALRRGARGAGLGPLAALGCGVSLACAVLVKESAALEAAFAGVVILRIAGLRAFAPLACGSLAAVALSALPYALAHELPLYWDANWSAVARRAFVAVTDATPPLDVLRAQALAFFPVTLLAVGLPWFLRDESIEPDERRLATLALVWASVDLLTVVAIRERLGNHFIPLMAPASVLGALVAVSVARRRKWRAFVPAVLTIGLIAHAAYQFILAAPIAYARIVRHDPAAFDTTAQLAAYISAHATTASTLYVADDRVAIYLLTGMTPPTRYAYAAHLVDPYQEIVAGVDGRAEVARIMATRPSFVVRDLANRANEDPRVRADFDRVLAADYRRNFTLGPHVVYVPKNERA